MPPAPLAFNNMVGLGCAHFNAGRYREAARWQERALREHPSSIWIHRTLSAAYMLGGAAAEARRSLGAWRETCPDLTLSKVAEGFPPMPRAFCERVVQVLDDLGLPS